jgi:hypothetical protein
MKLRRNIAKKQPLKLPWKKNGEIRAEGTLTTAILARKLTSKNTSLKKHMKSAMINARGIETEP